MKVIELFERLRERLQRHGQPYGESQIVARGYDEKGDYVELKLYGEFREDRDMQGRPIIVIR